MGRTQAELHVWTLCYACVDITMKAVILEQCWRQLAEIGGLCTIVHQHHTRTPIFNVYAVEHNYTTFR